jgi:hypothetical protein
MSDTKKTASASDEPPRKPSGWDIVKQVAITSTTFVVVSAIAGPVAGALAAAAMSGSGDDGNVPQF